MDIKKELQEKKIIFFIEGRVDTYTAPDLEKAIDEELDNFDELTLDFEKLEYISSAGLRVLISTQKKSKKDGFSFKIRNVNDTVNEILRMSKFDKILTIE